MGSTGLATCAPPAETLHGLPPVYGVTWTHRALPETRVNFLRYYKRLVLGAGEIHARTTGGHRQIRRRAL
jgi:hypothetical protein